MDRVSILPKGGTFVRTAIAKAVARDSLEGAAAYAAARWGEGSAPARILKAPIASGSTGGTTWGDEVVAEAGAAAAEFIGAVREKSVVGRLAGLRRRPPHTRIFNQINGATASWVKEGHAMKAQAMTFEQNWMPLLKVASMIILTDDMVRDIHPDAEAGIRRDLVDATAEALDLAFLDPTNGGVADEMPASVTNGATTAPPVGTGDADDFVLGFSHMVRNFGGDLTAAYVIGRPELFVHLNSFPLQYPNIGARGGEISGFPAIASRFVPLDSNGLQQLILLDPTGISFADDPAATEIKTTRQASIEMSDAPAQNAITPTAAQMVSLYQANAVAFAALSWANWEVSQPGSVSLLTGLQGGLLS